MINKIFGYIKNNKHCLLVLFWPVEVLWYFLLKTFTAESDVLLIHTPLDDKIVFCEWFIIPYCLWYLYIAAVLLYTLIKDKRDFVRACALICPCMLLPMLFCTIIPNGLSMSIRPDFDALGRENIATWLVKLIYAADTPPRNVMPSMHCAVSVTLFFSVFKAKVFEGKRVLKIAALLLSLTICASTVFVKQHSVLDVFAGIGPGVVVCIIVSIAERCIDKKRG